MWYNPGYHGGEERFPNAVSTQAILGEFEFPQKMHWRREKFHSAGPKYQIRELAMDMLI
jgi:hypothetical protein